MRVSFILGLLALAGLPLSGQWQLQAYVYESAMRGDYLNEAEIRLLSRNGRDTLARAFSSKQGEVLLSLPPSYPQNRVDWVLEIAKPGFKNKRLDLPGTEEGRNQRVFLKIPLDRLPGYRLELSIFAQDDKAQDEDALNKTTIEVYNRTMQREEMRLVDHPYPFVYVQLEQGNEYIFMLRKKGFYTKRMRANVNINGCILCMEGFGTVTPGVVDNLSKDLTMGTLIGSVALKPLVLNETMQIENVYYDLGKADLRAEALPELNKLIELMRDNPQIRVELSSHTDSRGPADKNLQLSQERANRVVAYLRDRGKIPANRIVAKGYGESKLRNSCADGVNCSEELHQQNRRTEITVIDIEAKDDAAAERSLASIMQEQDLDKLLELGQDSYFEEPAPAAKTPVLARPQSVQPPQALPLRYTGYKVELLRQKTAPDMQHPVLRRFETVYLDLNAEQEFCFLIGDFKTEAEAQNLLKSLKADYPQAKVQAFAEGLRN